MKIGVISDTHGLVPASVYDAFDDVEHIIHAGDIGGQSILDELELILPVTAVYGNCDYFGDYLHAGETAQVTLAGTRFFVVHKPLLVREALKGYGGIAPGDPLPHICIHGHTHVPRDECQGAVRVFCPGSPMRPRDGSRRSVLVLDVEGGRVLAVDFKTIERLTPRPH
ncbi:MAG TPA: metallophosphoesterase [Coriobacteriia bacterium]|nr:metallophosphoesterase [Coriobacteriia bacterium]